MKINILTLFPHMFDGFLEESIVGRAVKNKVIDIKIIDIREYSTDKHRKVDDEPYGGNHGMVMFCQPIFSCLRTLELENKDTRILYMSPRGNIIEKDFLKHLSSEEEVTILCGHYEGVDQRVLDYWNMEEVSIGDYVLTGGELASMVLVDAVSRFIPDVLGNQESAEEESIYSNLLEYDQYTRPADFEGLLVPEVLREGNHKKIKMWQLENSIEKTKAQRPDLIEKWKQNQNKYEGLTKSEKITIEKMLK